MTYLDTKTHDAKEQKMLFCVYINNPEVMNLIYIRSDGYRNNNLKTKLPIYVPFNIVLLTILICF